MAWPLVRGASGIVQPGSRYQGAGAAAWEQTRVQLAGFSLVALLEEGETVGVLSYSFTLLVSVGVTYTGSCAHFIEGGDARPRAVKKPDPIYVTNRG